jgi:hypothetical protein
MQHCRSPRAAATGLLTAAGLVLALVSTPVRALEPDPGEEKAVKSCERKLCTMVLGKLPAGPDLACDIAKTWDRDTLKSGESSSISWGFGDARCSIDLNLSRTAVLTALSPGKNVVQIPEHEVQCVVEQDGVAKPVVMKLAPKLIFKNGNADKIWINLKDINGPTGVKATVSMAAELEDKLGLFHRGMVKSVNKFLHKKCAERYFADGRLKDEPPTKKTADKSAAKAAAKPQENIAPLAADAK